MAEELEKAQAEIIRILTPYFSSVETKPSKHEVRINAPLSIPTEHDPVSFGGENHDINSREDFFDVSEKLLSAMSLQNVSVHESEGYVAATV